MLFDKLTIISYNFTLYYRYFIHFHILFYFLLLRLCWYIFNLGILWVYFILEYHRIGYLMFVLSPLRLYYIIYSSLSCYCYYSKFLRHMGQFKWALHQLSKQPEWYRCPHGVFLTSWPFSNSHKHIEQMS